MCSLLPFASHEESRQLCFSSGKADLREGKEPSSLRIRIILRNLFMKEREFL